MRSILMVVADILGQQPLQVPLVQDNHVIKQVSSTTPDPTLRNPVLPRTAKGSADRLASHLIRERHQVAAKLRVSVEQQEPVCWHVRPRFPHLLRDPKGCGTPRDTATKNSAPVVPDDEKAVQHTKGERRDGKEVHSGNRFAMIAQERKPSLDRIRRPRNPSKPA
jgi:hypothetical protein